MKLNLRTKLVAITSVLLALPILIIGIVSYTTAKDSLDELGATGLKNNVEMAIQMIDILNMEVEKGSLSLEEAQEQAKLKLLGEMKEDGKRSIDTEVDMGEYGYFFVLDKQGLAIAHPMREGENLYNSQTPDGTYSTQELIKKAESGGGFVTFDFAVPGNEKSIEPKISYTEIDPNWGWVVVAGSYLMDFNSEANQLLSVLLIVLGCSLLIGGILIIWFSGHLSKPIKLVTEQIAKVADGDLSSDQLFIKNKDEIGQLANYFNQMTTNLREIIKDVSNTSLQVAATSEELSASSEQMSQSVEQVAVSIQELATGSDTQKEKTLETNQVVSTISNKIVHIAENVEVVHEMSQQTASVAENGNDIINRTINQMRQIQSETDSTANRMNALEEKSNEIGKIVSMITSVAEQTNLLALNAAIEAARAGEHGKGFAVVADEVRKLAEQSREAAKLVNQLIMGVQEDINQSVLAMNEGKSSVDGGIELVNHAGEYFQKIVEDIKQVSSQMNEVSKAVYEISSGAESMVLKIDETTNIAEESASHSQNIAAIAVEQNASMEEIASVSDELAKMAEKLQDSIRTFTI
ncbi:methyl-accepting chemotaxis protein [Bacillus sp. DTU_2020_1000418_1_SI_GHA_SEK_038]|uniref:methyl-accepting chemotaxis protein n=1 Tax=Bacillus sp. DTU_2020_1000418_1_SI_GHA_SEK_038 TaxID=3077585 RepID=UPI0028EF068F|nr:methyl-accepting chemotaxis protein [Bacillus sp. DTU_2020_1000418_1_SI_GHA_SEK_038]WNS75871.1 methyl-accepting chemotaxis protein [Bacillus sp. DTU_2020_1000418_1_SI_GHA_SEK_038]